MMKILFIIMMKGYISSLDWPMGKLQNGTERTAGGKTQYALICVTVNDSLLSTPTAITHKKDVT